MLVRPRLTNFWVGDVWVVLEGPGDWHMYVPEMDFQ